MLPPIADPPRVPQPRISTSCSWQSITVASSLLATTESASAYDVKYNRYYAYDVTDGASPDPVMRRDLNPDFQWTYRVKTNVHPESCDSLLIRMAIGEVNDGIGPETIKILLQSVQLPIKSAYPPQNCVNWIRSVLHKLRFHGYARNLHNIEMTIDRALAYADLRMSDPDNSVTVLDHLGNELVYRPYPA